MPAPPRPIAPSDTSFSAEWGRWAPEIAKALIAENHDLDDVRGYIEAGFAQLWCDPEAAIVTEVITYPKRRTLRVWLAAGNYAGVRRCEARAAEWGKTEYGCAAVEMTGRIGWLRRLKDFDARAVVMTRNLT